MNKPTHKYKMSELCQLAGFSKQAHAAFMQRRFRQADLYDIVHGIVASAREIHPQMGIKKIYRLCEPDSIGRDRFLAIACELGLLLPKPKNYQRTTFSFKGSKFKNLAATVNINDINLVWVSDITYFRIKDKFYYITFIMDVYSRRIIGYNAADNLHADESCKALYMAIDIRKNCCLSGLVHHSDKGSQYISNAYTDILDKHNIGISMCESVFENSHIERVNGIIKNEYLIHRNINSFTDLKRHLADDVDFYNCSRPHWSIGCVPPVEFEKILTNIDINQRTILNMFSDNELYHAQNLDTPRLFR